MFVATALPGAEPREAARSTRTRRGWSGSSRATPSAAPAARPPPAARAAAPLAVEQDRAQLPPAPEEPGPHRPDGQAELPRQAGVGLVSERVPLQQRAGLLRQDGQRLAQLLAGDQLPQRRLVGRRRRHVDLVDAGVEGAPPLTPPLVDEEPGHDGAQPGEAVASLPERGEPAAGPLAAALYQDGSVA